MTKKEVNILSQLDERPHASVFYIWEYIHRYRTHKYMTKDEFHQSIIDKGKIYLRARSPYEEKVDFKKAYEYSKSHISVGTAATHLKKIQTS